MFCCLHCFSVSRIFLGDQFYEIEFYLSLCYLIFLGWVAHFGSAHKQVATKDLKTLDFCCTSILSYAGCNSICSTSEQLVVLSPLSCRPVSYKMILFLCLRNVLIFDKLLLFCFIVSNIQLFDRFYCKLFSSHPKLGFKI